MKRKLSHFILCIAAMLVEFSMAAQVKEISLTAGVNVPLYKDVENDAVITVSYGQFFQDGFGFRAGFQWIPSVADVNCNFGMPVALAFHTKERTSQERINAGFSGAADTLTQDIISDNNYSAGRDLTAGFLMNLFSDLEYFIGITPGYIVGSSSPEHEATWGTSWQYWNNSWTEKKSSFSLTLDAGMMLNYSLWRFDLKITPAFHYCLTNNYVYHISSGEKNIDAKTSHIMPLSWFFTLSGGVAFRF